MINSIRKLFNFYPKPQKIHLGRWAIKNSLEECNKYMIHLHADPGYISPFINKQKKYIDISINTNNNQTGNNN
jgi:hypothetical protein